MPTADTTVAVRDVVVAKFVARWQTHPGKRAEGVSYNLRVIAAGSTQEVEYLALGDD